MTEFKLKKTFLNTTVENHSDAHEVENKMAQTVSFPERMLRAPPLFSGPDFIQRWSLLRVALLPQTEVESVLETEERCWDLRCPGRVRLQIHLHGQSWLLHCFFFLCKHIVIT